MLDYIFFASLFFIVMIIANSVVICCKPFSADFKKAKKRIMFDSVLIMIFNLLICFFRIDLDCIDSLSSLTFVGVIALELIFAHELIQSIYISRLKNRKKH